jgi:urocanate hydratase
MRMKKTDLLLLTALMTAASGCATSAQQEKVDFAYKGAIVSEINIIDGETSHDSLLMYAINNDSTVDVVARQVANPINDKEVSIKTTSMEYGRDHQDLYDAINTLPRDSTPMTEEEKNAFESYDSQKVNATTVAVMRYNPALDCEIGYSWVDLHNDGTLDMLVAVNTCIGKKEYRNPTSKAQRIFQDKILPLYKESDL